MTTSRLLDTERQIAIVWDVDDVLALNPELTDEDAFAILQTAARKHDASVGINWDVLQYYVDDFEEAVINAL